MANSDVRLALFSGRDFEGRRILLRRGGVAVRDASAFRFDNQLSSFRLRNTANGSDVTLILFANTNYRGDFRVYRGNTAISDLGNFNDRMSSFIVVGRRLTDAQVQQIRNTRTAPTDVLHIRS
ncbi:hypothetical protein [Paenibacillus sp.]|uniref:hypothetical protein n=1 Tax=Paenibacillus sp. TaxID=58172 RepID=UPI002D548C94|nr:hypothetical protein [Paenibacillus sp.]HZG58796.1 hypothetical protein [Paenibacillus sp.]